MHRVVIVEGPLIAVPGLCVKMAARRALFVGWREDDNGRPIEAIVRYLDGMRSDSFDSFVPASSVRPE